MLLLPSDGDGDGDNDVDGGDVDGREASPIIKRDSLTIMIMKIMLMLG